MNINFNSEDYKDYLEGLCLSGKPIPFYNLQINHLLVSEVFDIGESNINDLVLPFAITKDIIEGFSKLDLGLLDLFLLINDDKYIKNVQIMLSILFKTEIDNVVVWQYVDENKLPRAEIIVNNELWIDNNKFDELRKIILKITNSKEIKKKDLKSNEMNFEDKKDVSRFAKLFKGREKEKTKKNKSFKLYNIFNSVVHFQYNIDYEKVLNMTIYQLYNTYTNLSVKENHDYTMRLASSGMVDTKGLEIKSLSEKLIK